MSKQYSGHPTEEEEPVISAATSGQASGQPELLSMGDEEREVRESTRTEGSRGPRGPQRNIPKTQEPDPNVPPEPRAREFPTDTSVRGYDDGEEVIITTRGDTRQQGVRVNIPTAEEREGFLTTGDTPAAPLPTVPSPGDTEDENKSQSQSQDEFTVTFRTTDSDNNGGSGDDNTTSR